MRSKTRGQMLVVYALVISLAALMLGLSFFIYSAKRQRDASEEIARSATRAGCMQVDEERMAQGVVWLDEVQARQAVLQVLQDGLPYLPYGLTDGATPDSIIAGAEIYIVNATPSAPQTSPLPPYEMYDRPFVAVRFAVPTAALFRPITLNIQREDVAFVRSP